MCVATAIRVHAGEVLNIDPGAVEQELDEPIFKIFADAAGMEAADQPGCERFREAVVAY